MAIVYRNVKGSELTHAELDGNFQYLDDNKVDKVLNKSLIEDVLITKLEGVEESANNYSHPATHPAEMIEETQLRQFVSADDKIVWDSKQDAIDSDNPLTIEQGGTKDGSFIPSGYNEPNGLVALDGNGHVPDEQIKPKSVRVVTTTSTLPKEDFGNIVKCTNTSDITLTLPEASEVLGRELIIYKSEIGVINLHTSGTDKLGSSRAGGTLKIWNKASRYDWLRILSVGDAYLVDGYADFTVDYDLAT